VVTFDFQRKLENRLREGLKVYIAYGIGEKGAQKRSKPAELEAEAALQNLARTYSNLRLTRLGDTHAKILVSDSEYVVVTSFNWLSFRGDPNHTFRDERGVMIMIPSLVDAQFDEIVHRMDDMDRKPKPTNPAPVQDVKKQKSQWRKRR
jgi:phosphatidylserine/phosphatidylglycerophosphate/cardiolipin synthase-like enzyme